MRLLTVLTLSAAASLATAGTAAAQQGAATAATIKSAARVGATLRGANNARLGKVTRVFDDGSVQIILGDRFVVVPAATLTTGGDGKLATSLTKLEVGKL